MDQASTPLPLALPDDFFTATLLGIYVALGLYWQVCEVRYWLAVRRSRRGR